MFDEINILENLLFLEAYKQKIPMYFTKKYKSFKKLKKFSIKNDFNYIFDYTGVRLKTNFKINKNIKWDKYKFQKNNYNIKLVNNYYKLYVNNIEYKHTTIVLKLLDKNKKLLRTENYFGFITNLNDSYIIQKYKINILY